VAQGFHCGVPLEASVLLETLLSGQIKRCETSDGPQPIQLGRPDGATETTDRAAPAALASARVAP
jgi:hypothetical protein